MKENTRKLNIKHGGKGFEIIRMAEKFDCKIRQNKTCKIKTKLKGFGHLKIAIIPLHCQKQKRQNI